LLLGQANFSGKLPITFPVSAGQAPMQYNHYPTGRGDDYLDGSGQAMYPFGYGLSYTQFEYSDLSHPARFVHANDTITLRFKLKNVGNTTGTEVVQLYLRDELASLARPVKSLRDFARITLKPGEETIVQFRLDFEDFYFLKNDLQPIIEPGDFRIMIGSSSKDIRLRSIITYQP
jgi:beta-glucosidase